MKIYNQLLTLILASMLGSAYAQTGDNKVVVQVGFTPSIGDAQKINSSPQLRDTVYKVPEFKYSIEEMKMETPFEIVPIKPAKLSGVPLNKLYSNYVAMGMGNYLTPFFEFYHSKLRSRTLKYGIHVKHLSSAGSIKDYAFPALSDNEVELTASKILDQSIITSQIAYQRNVFHYYGFKPSLFPDSLLPKDVDIAQRFNLVEADFNWYRYKNLQNKMNYNLQANYYYLQDFYRASEHQFALDADFSWNVKLIQELNQQKAGIKVKEIFYHNILDTLSSYSTNLVTISPYYHLKAGGLTAKIGLDVQAKTDSITELYFYPAVNLILEAIPDVLFFNFAASGGQQRNSFRTLTDENPFVISQIPLSFTNQKFQVNFGLGSSISKSINFNFQLFYDHFENATLFVNDTNNLYNNQFSIVFDDYDRVNLKAGITYQKHENLRILLLGNYYSYNMTKELFAWHKPNYDVNLSVNYNIQDKILLKAAIINYGSSKAPIWTDGISSTVDIKSWIDANLGVEYRYRKKIGIFLNLNNLTASKYNRWYNYPSYRFNFMAGFSYIF